MAEDKEEEARVQRIRARAAQIQQELHEYPLRKKSSEGGRVSVTCAAQRADEFRDLVSDMGIVNGKKQRHNGKPKKGPTDEVKRILYAKSSRRFVGEDEDGRER